MKKFVQPRPYADPDAAARKIVEIANGLEPYMDSRLLVERINGPFLYEHKGTPAEYKAGLDRAIDKGWMLCTRAELTSASPRRVRICSPKRPLPFSCSQ
jgi:hypothetical protein